LSKFKQYEQQYASNPASVGKLGPLLSKILPRIEQAIAREARRVAHESEGQAILIRPEPASKGRIGGIEI
jgi:hypothetical protein